MCFILLRCQSSVIFSQLCRTLHVTLLITSLLFCGNYYQHIWARQVTLTMKFYEQDIGDIVIGSVLGDSSQRAIQVRIAGLLSGIPEYVPVHTVNR